MKTFPFILYLSFLSIMCFGQEDSSTSKKGISYSLQAGMHYKTFFGDTYIEPEPFAYYRNYEDYGEFNKIPTTGLSAGLNVTYNFNAYFGISSGLVYVLRRTVFEKDMDVVTSRGDVGHVRNIYNVMEFNYLYNDLQIPLMVHFDVKKVILSAGVYFSAIAYRKADYTYVVRLDDFYGTYGTSKKSVSQLELPVKFFPTFQAGYSLDWGQIQVNPYLGLAYEVNSFDDYYFQLGAVFPLGQKVK